MSSVNQSVSRVREVLNNPREQAPTIKSVFGSVLREYQNFSNALGNSSQPWTVKEHSVNVNGAGNDYLISGDTGKVLFVTAGDNSISPLYPYPVEFTDLADASSLWWSYYPVVAARPEDYNFAAWPIRIAFYRKNGSLYARIPAAYYNHTLTITVSTGDWVNGVGTEQSAVLSNHHHLPEIRAAMNLIPSSRWTDDLNADLAFGDRLMNNLMVQEKRAESEFVIAKRSLTSNDVVFIETNDNYF